ncbi:hypothetical protein KC571_02030 [candidate division WWE3 bacterium]|uniref:Uncharacterized protein n=1 Tax=candidate division WWE3 bacterium TaxID=2053526 RepID=A0A955LH17_UNCKA|nr:hypothetical protein [candidate division WWE3 bacterium]
MSLKDIPETIKGYVQWLNGDAETAFISGFLLGVRLGRVLATKEISGEWTTGLNWLASQTYMGDMRQNGMPLRDFQAGLMNGSGHVISLPAEAFPHPELMVGETGFRYAEGIFAGVDAIFQDGMSHFINGLGYTREAGPPAYQHWIKTQEELVAALMTEVEQAQQN